MRIVLLLILAGFIAGAPASSAQADQYRWCALLSGGDDGGVLNCYFETLKQCEAAALGTGGFCMPSPFDGNLPAKNWPSTNSATEAPPSGPAVAPTTPQATPTQRKKKPS